jgi:SNF2 family DNA or RNA helicase
MTDIESKLYPYQKEVVDFMCQGSCVNSCFVGAGKTLITLATAERLNAQKTLIVVPKSVLLQWATQEIPKWLPEAKITAIQGSARQRQDLYYGFDTGYMVVGYETARIDIAHLLTIDWDVVACDEAHRLASPRTQTYKALSRLRARRRYAMTATPIMNRVEDLYGILNWCRPGVLGNYYGFINRYCVKGGFKGKQIVGNKNTEELAQRVKPYIIRKTLEEVGLQLPDKTETDIPVQLSDKEQLVYNQIRANLLFEIESASISKIENPVQLQNMVVQLGKLFELCDSLELLGDSTESSKISTLKELLEDVLV